MHVILRMALSHQERSKLTNRSYHQDRYNRTLAKFVQYYRGGDVLDLGYESNLSQMMKSIVGKDGKLYNTSFDLDNYDRFIQYDFNSFYMVTAFEIFEHLLNPFMVLHFIPSDRLMLTVPLKVWFSPAYRKDENDEHYHEFEIWQIQKLLRKTHWKIIDSEKWYYGAKKIGIRPLLRLFYPSYYWVYAERG